MARPVVLLIRHAEKPDGPLGAGVTQAGTIHKESLTVRGWQRAGALAYLLSNETDDRLPAPSAIYASADGPQGKLDGSRKESGSQRPRETVSPLAARLGLRVRLAFAKGQEKQLVETLTAARRGVTLVCWQHERIPEIARLLVGDEAAAELPQIWPGDRYDMVWKFVRKKRRGWKFIQIPQELLKGDSPRPIARASRKSSATTTRRRR